SLTFSFLEALGSGVPCIGVRADYPRRVTTADELIQDGVTGYCIGGASEAELTEALDRILGDPALRQRMGEEARRRCWRMYDWGRHVDGLMALAAQIGAGNGAVRPVGGLR
ncbi:MAG TPA: glycosyltransferase, partial [Candidatus Sulfotelmatobacter sp.]|nr:glycosyltransferase [Candidatus Sulfotelmatobacter sp.]